MIELMIICGLILLICITSSKILYKFGVPMLLIFIVLGMLFGSDGIVGIYFDDYELTSKLCSLGLVFIMFYGGFGTNWKTAKESAVPSILMSTLGVIITAGLTGLFCYFILGTSLLEGFLIGSVVGSTLDIRKPSIFGLNVTIDGKSNIVFQPGDDIEETKIKMDPNQNRIITNTLDLEIYDEYLYSLMYK